jgi:phage tail-like protein
MSTALNRLLGSTQGRIKPNGTTPPLGEYVFALGSDVAGITYTFNTGDNVLVAQTADMTGQKLVRFTAVVRPPTSMPASVWWELEWGVDAQVHGSRKLTPGSTLQLIDGVINVTSLVGNHDLKFRLKLATSIAAAAYEVELPGVWLDALVLDATPAGLVLASRNPEPGATGVPKASNIDLTLIATTAAATITLASTSVYVDGVLAWQNGVFQAGFTGPGSTAGAVAGPSAMYRIVIDPLVDFVSEATVSVRVVSATSSGATLDTVYTFQVEDLTAPRVVSAQATGHTTVLVSFDEAVKLLDASAADDALRPGNYAATPLDVPAVTPTVTLVRAVTDRVVELTLSTRASLGRRYRVTVTGVEDTEGNAVQAPFNTADFVAPACPKPEGRDFDLYKMLPQMNRREDETKDLEKFAACLQEVTDVLLCEVDRFADALDPDTAPEDIVDAMLADLGNPFAFDLTLSEKRQLVRLLVPLYKQKGTDPGIRNAVRVFLGFDVTLTPYLGEGLSLGEAELGVDWVLGPSSSFMRYAFDVNVAFTLTAEQRARLRTIVKYMKPSHTHLVNIVEPTAPTVVDHLELGLSELGVTWELH